jgi:hypothetical protein
MTSTRGVLYQNSPPSQLKLDYVVFYAGNTDRSTARICEPSFPSCPHFRLLMSAIAVLDRECLLGTSADGGHLERSEVSNT